MEDEAGPDAKLICVPNDPLWEDVDDVTDLPESLRSEIQHFFDVYKTLEPNKSASTKGFEGRAAAFAEVEEAAKRESH
jgi:inorganic pyrophosphatase